MLTVCGCRKQDAPQKQAVPGIGRLGGVRISIPAEYQFFPVEYMGDDIWARPPKHHARGEDVPIRSFSILLHLPDFAPRTGANEDSWSGKYGETAKDNDWIQVGVEPTVGIGDDPAQWFSWFIRQRMDAQVEWIAGKANWYFQKEAGLVFGLVNEKKVGPDYSKISVDNKEVLYDKNRTTTYIVCGAGAGGAKFCKQEFLIFEIGALASVHYAKENLKSWTTIQKNVRRIVLSFRV